MSSIGPARYTREFSNMTPAQIRKVLIEGAGTIRNTGEPFEYRIRLLGDSDVDEICRLHRLILNSLPDQLLLYERDSDFFAGCVRGQGCVVGALAGDALVGYATMWFPGPGDDNYGTYLDLPRDELPHVAHLAGSSIHPRFRGNGLQLQLLRLRTAFASGAGYYHQCGEVLPGNVISIENHLSCGYFLKDFASTISVLTRKGCPTSFCTRTPVGNPGARNRSIPSIHRSTTSRSTTRGWKRGSGDSVSSTRPAGLVWPLDYSYKEERPLPVLRT